MAKKDSDDAVKKIFGKTAEEVLATPPGPIPHDKYHTPNAFCGNAGPEEMKHFQRLLDVLSDDEIRRLVDAVGISFLSPTSEVHRDIIEGVLDEADREKFYREYHKILNSRK
jgi:hypothetical protein